MNKKRRKIYFIDKIFQKKLLILFLGINIFVIAANIAFYLLYLRNEVEDNMFKSHITIDNISEVIAGNVLVFNIILGLASLVLIIIFYTIIRKNLKGFFNKISNILYSRQEKTGIAPYKCDVKEEFYEIDKTMKRFIDKIRRY